MLNRSRSLLASAPRSVPARVSTGPPAPPIIIREHFAETKRKDLPPPAVIVTLLLWVFDDAATYSLLGRLERLGPVYLLRGGGFIVADLEAAVSAAFGRVDKHIESTEAEVLERLAGFDRRQRRPGFNANRSMLCTDDVWQFALDRLLDRATVIVVDLSDYAPGNAGIEHELGVLLDRVPLGQVVFVAGPGTDREGFESCLARLWTTVAADSPNRLPGGCQLCLVVTTSLDERSDKAEQRRILPTTFAELDLITYLVHHAAARSPGRPQ